MDNDQKKVEPRIPDDHEEYLSEDFFSDNLSSGRKPRHFRYPWVHQNDEMDCGPACMAMISKFWGNPLSLQFWRQRLYTNQLGTTLFDVARAAEKNGFLVHPIGVNAISDVDQSVLPALIARKNHYLVVYEINKKTVTIGDPRNGIRKISHEEFNLGFQKAVLLLRPVESFWKLESSRSKYSHYFKLLGHYWRELIVILILSSFLVAISLIPPLLLQIIFDTALSTKDYTLLYTLIVLGLVTSLSTGILTYTRTRYVIYVSSKFDFTILSTFFRKLLSLPYDFVSTRHLGDFTRRLTEMEKLRAFMTHEFLKLTLDSLTIIFFAFTLYSLNPKILSITFSFCFLMSIIPYFFSGKLISAYQETFTSQAEQDSLVADTIRGIATIKTMNCEVTSRWRLEERIATSLKAKNKFYYTSNSLELLSGTFSEMIRLVLVGTCAYLAIRGDLTPGQAITTSVLVSTILGPFESLSASWGNIQEIKAIARRLNDVFLAESESQKDLGTHTSSNFEGSIEFQGVWFRYGGESNQWALKDVSFKIPAGNSVALIGPSGSGKSTIAQLLGGLYKPTRGKILIDGVDLNEYDPSWLRKKMGFILPEPSLFHGTIAENIALADPHINDARVLEVAEIANASQFIMDKPNGIDYQITHSGLGLSGGEKQRIAFARAIYNDPAILVLDEATSALDGISERAVMRALKQEKRTMINIAHRYSTAVSSDSVILLSEGTVVGTGTHEQLGQSNQVYRDLFRLDDLVPKKGA